METKPITTTESLLVLHQLFSPGFPVGGFAYSHGLETAIEDGTITTASGLQSWLEGVLRFGAGWTDAVFLALAAKGGKIADLSELALALCPSAERKLETEKQGFAFAQTANALFSLSCTNAPYPVAVGEVVRALDLPLRDSLRLYLFAFSSNLATAGIRLIPLGQSEGQGVITALGPLCSELADTAIEAGLNELGNFSPGSDIASMRHEILYSRVFRS